MKFIKNFLIQKETLILLLILIAGSFLILTNLSNIDFWQDEGESVMLAKNTLKYGYPRVWDEQNLISAQQGADIKVIKGQPVWMLHPWLPNYLMAGSFALLGINNFSARFPFALLGILAIYLTYLLGWRLTNNRKIGLWTAFFLTLSVPFLLHVRQARYYSLSMVLVLSTLLFYLQWLKEQKGLWKFWLSVLALFYANSFLFFGPVIGIMIHYFFFTPRKSWLKFLGFGAITLILILPWLIFFTPHLDWRFNFGEFISFFNLYLRQINYYFSPIIFLILFYYLPPTKESKYFLKNYFSLWIIIILSVVFWASSFHFENAVQRYIITILPLMMVMAAIVFTQLWNWKKWISAGLIIFFITTNWLNIFPFNLSTTKAITKSVSQQSDWERLNQPHCYLLDFLRQLFTPYNGTVETIVNYLKKNASPDNVVVINSEVEVLAFYTHLTVLHPFELKLRHLKPEQIKWVIDRGYTTPENKILTDLKLDPNQYETINLGVPNSFFNNSPDLSNFRESWSTHFFTPPNYYQPLLIFKRK